MIIYYFLDPKVIEKLGSILQESQETPLKAKQKTQWEK